MAKQFIKKRNQIQKVVKKVKPVSSTKAGATSSQAGSVALPTGTYTEGIGRRKVATARVRLFDKPGDFVVNGKVAGDYFNSIPNAAVFYTKPFDITGTKGKFAVSVKVNGSGTSAQLEATIHGISRALVEYNAEYKTLLKKAGLLTRDDRMKETRKIGTGGKARRKRQSPKR